jgi:G:T-mismatch repair DNA endonuclease (very short patch repair protein)
VNVARDRRQASQLRRQGYSVRTIWECQTERQSVLLQKLAFLCY